MSDSRFILNLKCIRDYNGLSNKEMADDLNISLSYFEKILAGTKEIPNDVLSSLVKLSGIPENDILYSDLSTILEKKGGIIEEDISFLEIDNEFKEILKKYFGIVYPLVEISSIKNDSFDRGVQLYNDIMNLLFSNQEILADDVPNKLDKLINCFDHAYRDGIKEAALNVLSCLGLYWAILGMFSFKENFNVNAKLESAWDYLNHGANGIDKQLLEQNRKEFLEQYNSMMTHFMKHLLSTDYVNFSYYFLALRYINGMLDSDITKLSYEEETRFGLSYMDCLSKMGNEYAKKYLKSSEDLFSQE